MVRGITEKRLWIIVVAILLLEITATICVSAESNNFIDQLTFQVNSKMDAGLEGSVVVEMKESKGGYTGTIYLPGKADTSKLFLSWNGLEGVIATDGSSEYVSGELPIAAKGNSVSYTFNYGQSIARVILKTRQGSSSINSLFLTIDESKGTIEAMNADANHETSCYGSLAIDGQNYWMSMKGRGNTSWQLAKNRKPYNITIYKGDDYNKKKSVELISGVSAKKWSILTNEDEQSLLRNRVGLFLADRLGVGIATRYVDVWMNGSYRGCYLMTPKTDYNAPSDGWQIEIDNNTDTDPQFTLDGYDKNTERRILFTVKSNESSATTEDIREYMQKAADAIKDSNSDEYLEYIDIDSWAKMYILYEYYKDWDTCSGSKFMTRASLNEEDKLIAGPVWDLSLTLGRPICHITYFTTADGWFIDSIDTDVRSDGTYPQASWLQDLGRHEDFMKRVYEIYNEYKSAFDELPSYCLEQQALIQDSANMNYDKFGIRENKREYFFLANKTTVGSGKYALEYNSTYDWNGYATNLGIYLNKRSQFLSDMLYVEKPEGSIVDNTDYYNCGNISLSAELTAGSSNAAYQWQKSSDGVNWTNIKGATSSTFEKTKSQSLKGKYIRCIVTNSKPTIVTQRVKSVAPTLTTELAPIQLNYEVATHSLEKKRSAQKASLDNDGAIDCWVCADCGEIFADEEGKESLDKNEWKVRKIASVALAKNIVRCDGSEKEPEVVVKDANGESLENGVDYTVSYARNFAAGRGEATITFKGKYEGSVRKSFIIKDYSRESASKSRLFEDNEGLRIAGDDRFLTSIATADALKKALDVGQFDNVIVSTGYNYPDALAGGYLSAQLGNAPILLVDSLYVQKMAAYISDNMKVDGKVYILGSNAAVPSSMETELNNKGIKSENIVRVAGADRYLTNIEVLKAGGLDDGGDLIVCNGENYADGLSASGLGLPILMVSGNDLSNEQKEYLEGKTFNNIFILGQSNSVAASFEKALSKYVSSPTDVVRLSGSSRVETSVVIAEQFYEEPESASLVYAWLFPDGLSAGPLAHACGSPVLLGSTDKSEISAVRKYIRANTGISCGVVLGGDSTDRISNSAFRRIIGYNI